MRAVTLRIVIRTVMAVLSWAICGVAEAQWSVNRNRDGTVSAWAVANDGHLGVMVMCTTEGNMMAGIGSWLFQEITDLERGEHLVEWWVQGGNDYIEMMVFAPGAPPSLLSKRPLEFARILARSSPEAVFATETAVDAVSLSGSYQAITAVADACGWKP